jgi:hypothetical protein
VGAAWREGRVDRAGKLVEGTKKLEWTPCGWWCGGACVWRSLCWAPSWAAPSWAGWLLPGSWALVARRRDQDVDARKREQAHRNR